MYGVAANACGRRVLERKADKLRAVGPPENDLEELADPSDDLALPSAWKPVHQLEEGILV